MKKSENVNEWIEWREKMRKKKPVVRRERNEDKMLLQPNWKNTTDW